MKKFWKAFGIAAAYFAVFVGIQIWLTTTAVFFLLAKLILQEGAVIFLDTNHFLDLYLSGLTNSLTGMILICNIVTILGFWIFFSLREKNFAWEIGLHRLSGKNVILSILFGVGLCYTVGMVTELLPVPEDVMEEFLVANDMLAEGSPVIAMLSVALIGPASEEICFRGLCYTRLKRGMRPVLAGMISGVFFGIAHGNAVWFLAAFLAGIAMAWIYEITGSLWASILVHMTNNTLSQLSAYFPMPPLLNGILVCSSLILLLVSGYLLYRGNRKPTVSPEFYIEA